MGAIKRFFNPRDQDTEDKKDAEHSRELHFLAGQWGKATLICLLIPVGYLAYAFPYPVVYGVGIACLAAAGIYVGRVLRKLAQHRAERRRASRRL